jgi:hypothetical protein
MQSLELNLQRTLLNGTDFLEYKKYFTKCLDISAEFCIFIICERVM